MNQQPDKFFRDKLRDHRAMPSPDAWRRVAYNLDKKRDRKTWIIRIAASVLVLLATGIFLLDDYSLRRDDNIAESNPKPAPLHIEPSSADSALTEPTQVSPPLASKDTEKTTATPKKKTRITPTPSHKENTSPPRPAKQEPALSATPVIEQQVAQIEDEVNPLTIPAAKTTDTPQRVTIVFNADEVNEKYLRQKEEEHATSEQEESSGMQRLLVIARDFKINQDPIGELRQKKDQILAGNFRNDKKNNQAN